LKEVFRKDDEPGAKREPKQDAPSSYQNPYPSATPGFNPLPYMP